MMINFKNWQEKELLQNQSAQSHLLLSIQVCELSNTISKCRLQFELEKKRQWEDFQWPTGFQRILKNAHE